MRIDRARESSNGRPSAFFHRPRAWLSMVWLALAFEASGASASTARHDSAPSVETRAPVSGSVVDEASLVLGWTRSDRASEYVVFVSTAPLAGRSAEALAADPNVVQVTTQATALRFQDVVRGAPGRTLYHWAVAARDRATGRLALSPEASFSADKRFEAGSAEAPMMRAAGRGSLPPPVVPRRIEIRLQGGRHFDPTLDGEPPIEARLRAAPPAPGGIGSYVVQLGGPVRDAERKQLESAGAKVFAYLPDDAFLARMSPSAASSIGALPFVRWTGPWHPAYKISGAPLMQRTSGRGTMVALLFPDADVGATRRAVEALGGSVLEATDSGRNKILRVSLDLGRVTDLAGLDPVAWVEPWAERFFFNSTAQWVVQTNVTNSRRVWDMGLHGEGQVVHISDSGVRASHNAFRDAAVSITDFGDYPSHRKIIAYRSTPSQAPFGDHAGADYHGTHTCGTIAGDDSPFAGNPNDGQALKAKLYFHDIGAFGDTVYAPNDLSLLFAPAYAGNAGGAARISSNSWGSLLNQYDVQSMTIDQFMWDHKDFLVCFANGNQAGPGTVGSPATNKDGMGVGATQNGSNAGIKASFSSEGPTTDGRRKPTVMTPGDGSLPLSGISSAYGANDTGYQNLAGTSMATPAAAGAAALIRQYFTEGWYPNGAPTPANAFNPSAALLKAMAITSTDNDMTGNNIPNTAVGWGRVKLDNILYFPGDPKRTAVVDENDGLATGEFADYELNVTDASQPLKITLCWTDKEGSPGAAVELVNDLDLSVTDPGNLPYVGNVFAGGQSVPGGVADPLNVEEGVRLNTPALGKWKIRVSATNVPFGPQPYALVVSGGIGGTSGVVQIDKLRYGRDDQIEVRVEDLNAGAPVTVGLTSTTESTPEIVTLSGSGGVYTATVPTTAVSAVHGDGKLSVSNGDAITVTYADASPLGTVSVGATADFDGPVIRDVRAVDDGAVQRIGWTTDILASSRVDYGTTPALGQSTAESPALSTAHAVPLLGLTPETEYFFDVESRDHTGNLTRDDNAGQHYRFTTGKRGEILVVIADESSFAKDSLYVQALVSRGWLPSVLKGGLIAQPPLGDRSAGLRSYRAVWWQPGQEQYPPVEDAARDSLTAYLLGGGRLAICGHDVVWALSDPTSGYSNAARQAWVENTLHERFLEDPLSCCVNIQGIGGDPISGGFTTGVAYAPHREGAAVDEIETVPGTGTADYVWLDTDATPDHVGVRWVSNAPNGSAADAVWGGQPSRLVVHNFEWAGVALDADRAEILDKTLVWLIGRDHPDLTVTSPNGGESITTDAVSLQWTETTYGGTGVAARSLWYSTDGGSSWNLISPAAGPPPYSWDVSGLGNGAQYRVRVSATDDGSPSLTGQDASDADFALARPGGDQRGPQVVAGSIRANPNPIDNRSTATLSATVTDVSNGASNVTAAEFWWGAGAVPAGSGTAMTGAFGSPTVAVSGTVPAFRVHTGEQMFWVRGRDAQGNWGTASMATFVVNGDATVDVASAAPLSFGLEQNAPNPFARSTTIGFTLPRPAEVKLEVYGIRGERVRTLISGPRRAGRQAVSWDGRDESGQRLGGGIYFYRLTSGSNRVSKRLVLFR